MPPFASDALVLRTYKLGESSKVVVLLTRERGKVRAVAKGVRGPRSRAQSALEPLSEVRVSLYGRQGTDLFRLGACELIRSAYRTLTRGLEESLTLSYVAELLDAFSPEHEAEDAVYRLARALLAAAESGRPLAVLARYAEAWLLRLHGLYPPLEHCAGCGAPAGEGALRYHAPAHGFVCDACGAASGPVLSPATRAFLSEVFRRPPDAPGLVAPPEPERLESFHRGLIGAHLERDLRAPRVLRDVAREVPR
jgi:DNA repair protein RecO (recombination protein O)